MSSCAGTIVLISFSFVDFATHEGSNNNNKKITERQVESSSETWHVLYHVRDVLRRESKKKFKFSLRKFSLLTKIFVFLHSMSCEYCENISHHCAIFYLHFSINFPSKVHLLSIVQWTEFLNFYYFWSARGFKLWWWCTWNIKQKLLLYTSV